MVTGVIDQSKGWVDSAANYTETKLGYFLPIMCYLVPDRVFEQFTDRLLRLLTVLALRHAVSVELQAEQKVGQHLPHHLLLLLQDLPQSHLGLAEVPRQLESSEVTNRADQEKPETSVRDFVLVGHQIPNTVGRCDITGLHIDLTFYFLLFVMPGQRVTSYSLGDLPELPD